MPSKPAELDTSSGQPKGCYMRFAKAVLGAVAGICLFVHPYAFAIDPSTLQKGAHNQLTYTFPVGSGLSAGKSLTYLLYLPLSYTSSAKLPLIVHMHGGGAKSSWPDAGLSTAGYLLYFLKLNPNWSEASHPCVILEPFCGPAWCGSCWDSICAPAGPHIHNLNSPRAALQIIRDFIPIVQHDLGLDTSRCYIVGWSNGGSASWDLIMYWPDFFSAAVPIAGAGDTLHAYRELNVPVWAGMSQDDNVVPPIGTTSMVDKLTSLGGSPHHTYVNGWQHFSEGAIWQTPELVPWLFSQVRKGPTVTESRRGPCSNRKAMTIRAGQNGALSRLEIQPGVFGAVADRGSMRLTIFNTSGCVVLAVDLNLIDNDGNSGGISLRNSRGEALSPGNYLCRLEYNGSSRTMSLLVSP
jgi:hypothetical protein